MQFNGILYSPLTTLYTSTPNSTASNSTASDSTASDSIAYKYVVVHDKDLLARYEILVSYWLSRVEEKYKLVHTKAADITAVTGRYWL